MSSGFDEVDVSVTGTLLVAMTVCLDDGGGCSVTSRLRPSSTVNSGDNGGTLRSASSSSLMVSCGDDVFSVSVGKMAREEGAPSIGGGVAIPSNVCDVEARSPVAMLSCSRCSWRTA